MIVKDSDEEKNFIAELIVAIRGIDTNNISDIDLLKNIVQSLTYNMERKWAKNSKIINITKHSKSWWDTNCNRDLENTGCLGILRIGNDTKNSQKYQACIFQSKNPRNCY